MSTHLSFLSLAFSPFSQYLMLIDDGWLRHVDLASTAAIKTVFVLPLDCTAPCTCTRVVDSYDD